MMVRASRARGIIRTPVCTASRGCAYRGECRAECRWEVYVREENHRRAGADRRKAVRECPLPKFEAAGRPANWCRWCGGEIVHGRAFQRSWHDGREDEADCKHIWHLHTDLRFQYPHLVNRDGEKCADCGETPGKWLHNGPIRIYGSFRRASQPLCEWVDGTQYTEVRYAVALEVDHDVPLWSVAHLPDDERRPFFGPDNQKLRCEPCHDAKTAGEAGTRAKGNRQAKMRVDVPREPSKRPIKGRVDPWPKGRTLQSRGFR